MLTVSTKDFAAPPLIYTDKIDKSKAKVKPTVATAKKVAKKSVKKDDTLYTKEEWEARIAESQAQVRRGEGTLITSKEEMDAFFYRIEHAV